MLTNRSDPFVLPLLPTAVKETLLQSNSLLWQPWQPPILTLIGTNMLAGALRWFPLTVLETTGWVSLTTCRVLLGSPLPLVRHLVRPRLGSPLLRSLLWPISAATLLGATLEMQNMLLLQSSPLRTVPPKVPPALLE